MKKKVCQAQGSVTIRTRVVDVFVHRKVFPRASKCKVKVCLAQGLATIRSTSASVVSRFVGAKAPKQSHKGCDDPAQKEKGSSSAPVCGVKVCLSQSSQVITQGL